jgi:hypothetical protein
MSKEVIKSKEELDDIITYTIESMTDYIDSDDEMLNSVNEDYDGLYSFMKELYDESPDEFKVDDVYIIRQSLLSNKELIISNTNKIKFPVTYKELSEWLPSIRGVIKNDFTVNTFDTVVDVISNNEK